MKNEVSYITFNCLKKYRFDDDDDDNDYDNNKY
jgi:hypothetical protein